jgi:sialidase-1
MKHIKITGERHQYCAWPSIGMTTDGTILTSYCRSEEHLGPDGEIQVVRSTDGGSSWSSPIVARDSLVDDREGGMTFLSDGRILLHVWSTHHTPESYRDLDETAYEADVLSHWTGHVASQEYAQALSDQGGWILLSVDSGQSWRLVGPGPDTVHGGIQLDSGELLVAGYRTTSPEIGIFRASPDNLEWTRITAYVPPDRTDRKFGEPHIAQLPSGRIIMMLRSTAIPYDDESQENHMWCTYSDDSGLTWADARPTELWGFPPHLATLSDGRLLCTYGYRRKPYGERACVSDDGVTWLRRNEIVLRDDADNVDLGYPASLELESGSILSVYYQSPHTDPAPNMKPPDPMRNKPDIVGTYWNLDEIS